MRKLTKRQGEYLLMMAEFKEQGCHLGDIADRMNVSKPSAYVALDKLESMGYVRKDDLKQCYQISDAAKHWLKDRVRVMNGVSHWLQNQTQMTKEDTLREARAIAVSLSPESLKAMLDSKFI